MKDTEVGTRPWILGQLKELKDIYEDHKDAQNSLAYWDASYVEKDHYRKESEDLDKRFNEILDRLINHHELTDPF